MRRLVTAQYPGNPGPRPIRPTSTRVLLGWAATTETMPISGKKYAQRTCDRDLKEANALLEELAS